MSRTTELSIADDFSPFPGGRLPADGPFNGTRFRDHVLKPLLDDYDVVVLDLDGVAGLPSSFWEEVFGGFIRKHILSLADVGSKLKLRTTQPELEIYVPMAYKYAQDAARPAA